MKFKYVPYVRYVPPAKKSGANPERVKLAREDHYSSESDSEDEEMDEEPQESEVMIKQENEMVLSDEAMSSTPVSTHKKCKLLLDSGDVLFSCMFILPLLIS